MKQGEGMKRPRGPALLAWIVALGLAVGLVAGSVYGLVLFMNMLVSRS